MASRAHRFGISSYVVGVALSIAAIGGLAAPRSAAAATHSDGQLGYSLQVPQGWKEIPIAGEEKYIVAKYLCDREYSDKKEGRTHTPDLKVIVFPKGEKRGATVEKDGDTTRISFTNPYKDYPDYVKSDNTGGGHFISKEDKIAVNGVDTTWYEVTYEKLTVARRAIAFAYHWNDCDYVAQYEVLEQYWTKLSPALITSLKSFKIFPRKGSVKREVTGEDNSGVTIRDGDKDTKLTDEEKAKKRQDAFERRVRVASERLPDGWKVKHSKNFVAITHVEPKYTDYVLDQAEAVRAWLDEKFGWIGTEYVPGDIIRICTDYAEERAFRDLSNKSGAGYVSEITMSKTSGSSDFHYLNGEVRDTYFRNRNSKLAWSLPPWLSRGIDQMVYSAFMKGGKLEFRADGQEVITLRTAAKAGKLAAPRDMMLATYKPWDGSFDPTKASEDPLDQASGFVRYLVVGPGKSASRTKDILKTYIETVIAVGDEVEVKVSSSGDAPKTEEEEQEAYKNRQNSWREHEKERLQQIFDKVFGQWTAADWTAVERSYQAFVT